ncbi:uncharacterized protein LOC131683366 [Topomyia yanbarensis]|uniref:uncharacterized protein LOC131683366 n=1 Tax=Topomyia yanbarensis TaxID=2498891 RepID=UPI00273A8725|nr:uncharacterized protein LOC131683366 [Topomyia yanbarensis]
MESSTEDLDESMVDIIGRAEAFLSAYSNILNHNTESQYNTSSDLFESSAENVSYTTAESTSCPNSGSTFDENISSTERDQPTNSPLSVVPVNQAVPGQIEVLSDDTDNDSNGTVSYEVELPEAVQYSPTRNNAETDDCIVVSQDVPMIDLSSSAYGEDLEVHSRQSRRRRRRLGSSVPVVELITLDDSMVDLPVSTQIPNANLGLNSNAIPPPTKRITTSEMDLNVSQSSDVGGLPCSVNCPICFEPIFKKGASSTICGHLFCHSCINHEIQLRKKCPLCKRKLMRSQVHRVYFN